MMRHFFKRAQAVIDKIIKGQTLDVDTVSGATYSSRGIISAVKNALTGEKDSGTTGQSQSGSGAAAGSSTSVAAVEDPSAYKDGTYYGTGTGFGGTLKVKVEISGGKITSIQIMENQDGSEYISKASALINTIIQNQSTNVDTVSGATYSSVGIIQAVRNALSQAAVSTSGTTTSGEAGNAGNSGNQNQDTSAATGNFPYKEGIYYGTAEGYSGDVSVAVVIQEKSIKAILITETSDDEAFFQRAMGVVKNVLKNAEYGSRYCVRCNLQFKRNSRGNPKCIKAGRKSNKWGNHRGEGRYNAAGRGNQDSRSTGARRIYRSQLVCTGGSSSGRKRNARNSRTDFGETGDGRQSGGEPEPCSCTA